MGYIICPICGNEEVDIFYKGKNFQSKNTELKILGCDMCVVEVDIDQEAQARKEASIERMEK